MSKGVSGTCSLWPMRPHSGQRSAASDLVEFQVTVADSGREHTLWVHIGPGDTGEPVLTIMFPEDW